MVDWRTEVLKAGAQGSVWRARQMLSCGPAEHESAVTAVLAERSALTRERKALLEELSKLHAERLAAQLDEQGARQTELSSAFAALNFKFYLILPCHSWMQKLRAVVYLKASST